VFAPPLKDWSPGVAAGCMNLGHGRLRWLRHQPQGGTPGPQPQAL